MELEHVLRDVDAKGVDGHRVSSSSSAPLSCRAGGRAVHPIRWKQKYGGLMPSEVKKLRHLEEENTRLRKLVADLTLDKEMLSEVIH
jgi:putative transposase